MGDWNGLRIAAVVSTAASNSFPESLATKRLAREYTGVAISGMRSRMRNLPLTLGVLAALVAVALPSAAMAATATGLQAAQVKTAATPSSLPHARIARSALGPAVSFTKPAPARSVSRPDSVRPSISNSCPANGDWVGFTNGNTDINLEYDSNGSVQVGSCWADDQTLDIRIRTAAAPPSTRSPFLPERQLRPTRASTSTVLEPS